MKVVLEPIHQKESYSLVLEREIQDYFRESIFDQLRMVLTDAGIRANELPRKEHPAIWTALLAGTLWYIKGIWTGIFNAAISRELRAIGASPVAAGFAQPLASVPIVLRGGISYAEVQSVAAHQKLLALLDTMQEYLPAAPSGVSLADTVDTVVDDLQEQLVRTVSAEKELPLPPPVPPSMKRELQEQLAAETDRTIKGFSLETIQQIRDRARKNLSEGGRTDRLSKIIEAEFGVAQRKARIIADSETSFLVSRFRQQRYEGLGCTEYLWSTSHDEKVRPTHGESNNHRVLDGRRFTWASPPVVDTATGRRRHPGEDFGPCRCVARPIVNF